MARVATTTMGAAMRNRDPKATARRESLALGVGLTLAVIILILL